MMKPVASVRFLQFAGFLAPIIAVLAPRSLAVLLPVAAAGAGLSAWRERGFPFPPIAPTVVAVAALVWGAASALWSFEPRLVWSVWPSITGLTISGLVLVGVALRVDEHHRVGVGKALSAGIVIALVILGIEWVNNEILGHPLLAMLHDEHRLLANLFNRGTATIAILVWPAAVAVWRLRGGTQAAVLVAVTAVVISRFSSMAAVVAIVVGAAVCALAFWRPRPVAWALVALMAIGAIAAPVLPRLPAVDTLTQEVRAAVRPGNHIVSVAHRLEIWQFVAESIAVHPVIGWGLNSSRDLPGGLEETAPGARKLPLHPHNAMLQWWLELGAVGTALCTLLVIFATLGAARIGEAGHHASSAAALATAASGIVVALVGYGIWQAWWIAVLWLAAALMAAAGSTKPQAMERVTPARRYTPQA